MLIRHVRLTIVEKSRPFMKVQTDGCYPRGAEKMTHIIIGYMLCHTGGGDMCAYDTRVNHPPWVTLLI